MTDGKFRTWLTTKNGLIFRKALVAFIAAFLGVFIPAILSVLDKIADNVDPNWSASFLISLLVGAVAAGVRAAFAIIPGLNLEATDEMTSVGSTVEQMTVTTKEQPTTLAPKAVDAG